MIEIKVNVVITPKQIAAVYQEAEFDKSIENEMRLKKMLTETPLTISAWEKEQPIVSGGTGVFGKSSVADFAIRRNSTRILSKNWV
ncbi:hypothetical protein [Enterococcus songbeiensis]|uniref:hypothetical protein n=1 Tax=Enterococcus songbeiensis TaxID=2559927 RepID=UPI001FEBFE61|nr:hypothetical protein [Enterococcus songbeiensis]